jgi:hypothetical protein
MKNGFLTHLVAKNRGNKLKWRVVSAMLAGIALLFAFQGFSRAEDEGHGATAITDCQVTFVISNPGRYFLANDLKQCPGVAISISASDVKLELRGHTIQGPLVQGASTILAESADLGATMGATKLFNIEIAGPGTVTGGSPGGIDFENVHRSWVHNLVLVQNTDGIDVNASDPTNDQTIAATASTDNEFLDNVAAANFSNGIAVNGGNENRFIRNNLGGNSLDGLHLSNGNNNVVHQNTADSNGVNGIEVGTLGSVNTGSGNTIDGNIALGNNAQVSGGADLADQNNNCTQNTWTNNSFNSNSPGCIQ